ncbi:hypothetical protein Tco_1374343 [Tanacetum coccineum]
MASLDYRLNPLFTIKECSSCGSLYNKGYCCTPNSSQQPLRDCPKCGNPVEGPNCQGCALWRKKLKEVWFTICHENGIYQDLLNTYESSDDDTNVVNAPREPFVVKQDPGVNSLQSPPLIDHHGQAVKDRYWKIPICYDDDEDYTLAITPVLSTKEPVDSLIIKVEHLDTISATEPDEVIKSSVENLVQIPSESKGISDGGCDVPLCDNPTPLEAFKEHSKTIVYSNNDSTSSDDDYPYGENIEYVDASPPDAEIVSLEVVESVIPEVGGVDTDILLTIKDDILREKLLNVNLLIANIEALKDNPVPSSDFVIKSPSTFPNSFLEETNTFDNSLTESETFRFNLEEISSGSTTTRSDYSLPDYEAFYLNDNHIEEKSSGGTTTHADFSLPKYDSFIFDLSINPFPPADRSDFYHEEFADELAHIISPPDLECFYFKIEPDPIHSIPPGIESNFDPGGGEIVVSQNVEDDDSFTFVIRTFLPFLTYPADSPLLLSTGSEDTIFDPGYPDFEDSRTHGFVHSFELHILSFI